MNVSKTLVPVIAAAALLVLPVKPALAQETCETTYGGYGSVCKEGVVSLDKLVWDASNGIFVDNLGTADPFQAGNEVTFRLKITNTGDFKIDTVFVRDDLPRYVEYVSGPQADDIRNVNYDSGNRRLTFELTDLAVGETREIDFKVKIVGESDLPGSACVVNVAEAEANGEKDTDTAQICVTKSGQVLGAVMPETGPSQLQLLFLEALGFAIVGTLFIRTARFQE
jgi:uncharacterized repeat protein (TIGR01451 family)